jgi:ribonuclease HII
MRYVVGIDEVGRGPLAGPVVLAAVAIPESWRPRKGNGRLSLRDSKKLTELQRERWAEYLGAHPKVAHVIVKAYPSTIDEVNIARAANLAARRALKKLTRMLNFASGDVSVYLDGGLYLQKLRHPRAKAVIHTEAVRLEPGYTITAHTVVKGDEKIVPVRMASIFAKVHRDGLMRREAKKYPGYGFERHKGYATKSHYEAINKLGLSKIHRLTFLSKSAII